MTFLARLALLFVVVPVVELMLLIRLGQVIGLWPTLGVVVFTGIAGAALARAEGMRTVIAFQRELAQGRLPGQAMMDGASVLLGGAFLLTPGILTDLLGLALLLPPSRRWIQRRIRKRIERSVLNGGIRVMHRGPLGWKDARPAAGQPDAGTPADLDPTKEIGSHGSADERPGGRLA